MAVTDPNDPNATQRAQGPPLTKADMTPGEAAAAGLGWVDKNHPLYGTAGYVGSQPAGGAAAGGAAGGASGGAAGGNTVAGQGTAAQTYSSTPGADPDAATTNQGTQDVVRNSYLERATKPLSDPRTDQGVRMASDSYNAATERARRDATADLAEGTAGSGQVGFQNAEQRLINERAGQARGSFEADLVQKDLQRQRDETNDALSHLTGMISDDQARALQDKLASLDAQLKTAALNSSDSLGRAELSLKDKLGTGGLSLDTLKTLLNDQQFNKNLGFNIGDREAFWNQQALDRVLGGL